MYLLFINPKSGVKGDASPLRVEGSALVAVRRNLRTKCGNSVRSTVTLCAGAQTNEIIRARLPFSLFMSEFLLVSHH